MRKPSTTSTASTASTTSTDRLAAYATDYAAAKREAEAAEKAAEAAAMSIGNGAAVRSDAVSFAADMDIEDVSVRGRLFDAWVDGSAAAADVLFSRILPAETIGFAVAAATDLEGLRFAIRGEAWSELNQSVCPKSLAIAYVGGRVPSSDRIDAAAKAAAGLSRFFGIGRHAKGAKQATRSEKTAASNAWSESFKRECLTESERLAAAAAAAVAAAKAARLEAIEADFAAEAAAADEAFIAAGRMAAEAEKAMAAAMAKAEAAKAAAMAKAIAAAKAAMA